MLYFFGYLRGSLSRSITRADPSLLCFAAANTGGFRRAGAAAGPTSSHTDVKVTFDAGKTAPAAVGTESGFRRTGQAAGPGSSVAEYTPTLDSGKVYNTTGDNSGFRRAGDVAGPTSSHATYTPTITDPGKYLPSGQV